MLLSRSQKKHYYWHPTTNQSVWPLEGEDAAARSAAPPEDVWAWLLVKNERVYVHLATGQQASTLPVLPSAAAAAPAAAVKRTLQTCGDKGDEDDGDTAAKRARRDGEPAAAAAAAAGAGAAAPAAVHPSYPPPSEEERMFALWTAAELTASRAELFGEDQPCASAAQSTWLAAALTFETAGWTHDASWRRFVPFCAGVDRPVAWPWWTFHPVARAHLGGVAAERGVPTRLAYRLHVLHPATREHASTVAFLEGCLLRRWRRVRRWAWRSFRPSRPPTPPGRRPPRPSRGP